MLALIFSLTLVISALALGYSLRRLCVAGRVHLPIEIADLRKIMQKFALLCFMPIALVGAFWIVSFDDIRVAWLPIVGFAALLSGGCIAFVFSKLFGMGREQTGVMFTSGLITNLGALGSLFSFMFLGEAGFALVALYKMLEELCYYMIGFPVARYFGHGGIDQQITPIQRLTGVFKDPFVIVVFTSVITGLALNFTGVSRPDLIETLIAISVPVGTFLMIFSIGLGMRFSSVGKYLKPCMAISATKFVFVPLIACTLAYLFNLHETANGLPFMVVIICSTMPVGFNALVAASIFNLDLEMANSLWLVSTGLLLLVIPWLYFELQYLN
jgi:predicted permease